MPIKIDFLANVRDFLRGTDDAEQALDDVADSLDDMARDAKNGGRDAERAVEKLEDSFRDAARRAKDLGRAGEDAGDDVKRGMKRAEDGVDNLKDEANETAREAAASFDGSAESIADAFQEIAANAFAGFGPAGAVAGLAAAAGIGLAVAGFTAVDEAEKASRERAAEWAQAFIEAGTKVLSAAQTTAKGLEIFGDDELYQKAKDNAKNWGVDVSVAVAAMAGETWALEAAQKGLADQQAKLDKAMETTQVNLDGTTDGYADLHANIQNGKSALSELTGEMQAGQTAADEYSRFLTAIADNTAGATRAVDEFGDTIVTLPDGKQIYIDAQTGQATMNVDAIEDKIYGIPDGHANVTVDTWGAQNAVDRFVTQNNGRTVKIYGKFISSGGSWEQ